MNNIDDIRNNYLRLIDEATAKLNKVQQQIYRTSMLRLLLFVAGVAGLIYFRAESWAVLMGIVLVTLLPFLLLVKYHNRLFGRKDYIEKKIEINRQEADAIDYRFDKFDDGAKFADPSHLYSYDLDVFGPHSLFQYINRTCTQPGRAKLAAWLGQHLKDKESIKQRQEAVKELSAELDFRQHFRITGLLHKGKAADEAELRAWTESPSVFRRYRLLRVLPPVVTGINMLCLVLVACGVMPGTLWGLLWVCFVSAGFCFTGKVSKMQALYGKKLQILGTYARLLHVMEEQPMKSNLLQQIKNNIGGDKQQKASLAIRRLSQLMNELDQRNNMFMYVVLNGLFFWELHQMMRIEAWKEEYASNLPQWLKAIAEMDALNSLATFAYNHPDYAYPTLLSRADISKDDFRLQARALGHPLMERDRCVRNDIDMTGRPAFTIITGANMAGKSTYLRTIGVNYLLACVGAPVCATSMQLYPAQLITSLRTTDSLTDNESYFFAELKRLKLIIDKLQAGEELFIILDEILKGTNSMDKQKGSLALVKQFMKLKANGIIATHDLMLGSLRQQFPDHIRNYCFEADITNNHLTFSYHMREGVAQNMNACFLMKQMGIAMTEEGDN